MQGGMRDKTPGRTPDLRERLLQYWTVAPQQVRRPTFAFHLGAGT